MQWDAYIFNWQDVFLSFFFFWRPRCAKTKKKNRFKNRNLHYVLCLHAVRATFRRGSKRGLWPRAHYSTGLTAACAAVVFTTPTLLLATPTSSSNRLFCSSFCPRCSDPKVDIIHLHNFSRENTTRVSESNKYDDGDRATGGRFSYINVYVYNTSSLIPANSNK